jgi:putative cardiolipin synthase
MNALRDSPSVRELIEGRLALEWAATRLVSDDPAKGLGRGATKAFLPHKLNEIIGEPSTDAELVSAYFVPTASSVDAFTGMAKRGVKIQILTNSLEATDVAAVHAGYAKRRKPLLEAGITLYEMQRLSPETQQPRRAGRPLGRSSSASSLHAKTFSVDRARVFIGSFNFDPRSANLNTELGFVIESPALAQRIEAAFNNGIRANVYGVRLSDTSDLYWIERRNGKEVRHDTEPGMSFWKRLSVRLVSLLPVEWLL